MKKNSTTLKFIEKFPALKTQTCRANCSHPKETEASALHPKERPFHAVLDSSWDVCCPQPLDKLLASPVLGWCCLPGWQSCVKVAAGAKGDSGVSLEAQCFVTGYHLSAGLVLCFHVPLACFLLNIFLDILHFPDRNYYL